MQLRGRAFVQLGGARVVELTNHKQGIGRSARIPPGTSIEMKKGSTEDGDPFFISIMARPERFELPTTWFVVGAGENLERDEKRR